MRSMTCNTYEDSSTKIYLVENEVQNVVTSGTMVSGYVNLFKDIDMVSICNAQ